MASRCHCGSRDVWFDRTVCPDPCGAMHTCCADCGRPLDPCLLDATALDQATRVIEDFCTDVSVSGVYWTGREIAERLHQLGLLRE